MKTPRTLLTRPSRIAGILTIASVIAGAGDVAAADRGGKEPKAGPPAKPRNEVRKDLLENFKKQKEQFLNEKKDGKDIVKDELKRNHAAHASREEAKDAIAAAKERAREQARKLAEEAKEQADRERNRD